MFEAELKLSREAPATNALERPKRQAEGWLLQAHLSRQRCWGLVGSNFELGSCCIAALCTPTQLPQCAARSTFYKATYAR